MFILSLEIDCFLGGNRQQSNARAWQKNTHDFFGNARPKSNARAYIKQRKKHSGLIIVCEEYHVNWIRID